MALAYLTINLDAFTGDDHPPVPSYSTITLDPGADHIDAAADVIHVRTIVVSLDRQGKAATANGVPCVDGKVPVVAGVAYAVSAPNVLRGGPHYIPALTAGQVVDLSDYITPGAPLTPDQASALAARVTQEVTDRQDADAAHVAAADPHPQYTTTAEAAAAAPVQSVAGKTGAVTLTASDVGAATAAQGVKADTAVQPAALAGYVATTDPRLSDSRTPVAHNHAGADITSGTVAYARLPVGTTVSTVAAGDDARIGKINGVAVSGTPTEGQIVVASSGAAAAWAGVPNELRGTGSPEGVVTAPVGTYYTDTALTNGAMRWAKKSGSGNTGWVCGEGDTGWRDISSILSAGWVKTTTYGRAAIRRIGSTVFADFRITTSTAGLTAVLVLPTGFKRETNGAALVQPGEIPRYIAAYDSSSIAVLFASGMYFGGAGSSIRCDSTTTAYTWIWSGTWSTTERWPTTLPGVAA